MSVEICTEESRSIMDNWDELRTAYQVARMGTVTLHGVADSFTCIIGLQYAF